MKLRDKGKTVTNHLKEGGKGARSTGSSRRLWRAKKSVHKMVLGSDVGLAETYTLALCGLVGRLSYKYLCKVSIPEWVELNWKPVLGYSPEIIYLTKGWVGFICNTPEDTALLLAQRWVIGGSSLMIKRWHLAFNPETKYFQFRHLWVLLPRITSTDVECDCPGSDR
jgi:hypothetical protein